MRNPFATQTESTSVGSKGNLVLSDYDDDDDDGQGDDDEDEDDEGLTSDRQGRWIQSAGFGSPEWWFR